MSTYHLHRWSITTYSDDPWLAPEMNPICLLGCRIPGNKTVRTSPITQINGREITTETGSIYILEDMDPDYRHWLEDNGMEYDPANPIKKVEK